MKQILLLLLFLPLSLLQAQTIVDYDDIEDDDDIYYFQDEPYTGMAIEKDTVTVTHHTYVDGKEPLPNITYIAPKEMLEERGIKHETTNRLFKSYHANGQLMCEVPLDKDNKVHGVYTEYYDNGNLNERLEFKHGIKHGPIISYYRNKELQGKGKLKNGELDGLFESYRENGQPHVKAKYVRGKAHGIMANYDSIGLIIAQLEYKHGKLDGTIMRFYSGGQLEARIMVRNDKMEGLAQYYYENTQLKYDCTMKDDELNGTLTQYDEEGNVLFRKEYIMGELVGGDEDDDE